MKIDRELLEGLIEQARVNPRLRQNMDMRTSENDTSQRMLNALVPGTVVPIHRHEKTSESVMCLCGRLDEVFYEEVVTYEKVDDGFDAGDMVRKVGFKEVERIHLCPEEGVYGCQVPKGMWHTVEVMEESVIFESKDGKYK